MDQEGKGKFLPWEDQPRLVMNREAKEVAALPAPPVQQRTVYKTGDWTDNTREVDKEPFLPQLLARR